MVREAADWPDACASHTANDISVTLLTGGGDRPYVFGLATELISKRAALDLIGSDYVDFPEYHNRSGVRFLNLRGDQNTDVSLAQKVSRVLRYYAKLIGYAATAKPKIFHILWNNKIETFDRTLLMLYYKLLGKKVVLTVHNVNAAVRDSKDTPLNRLTLRIQYRLADHIFVHTEKMKNELSAAIWREGGPGHRHPVRDQQFRSEHASHSVRGEAAIGHRETMNASFYFLATSRLTRVWNT